MRRHAIATFLSLSASFIPLSTSAYATSELPAEGLIDALEDHSGHPVPFHDRLFLLQGLDCVTGGNHCGDHTPYITDGTREARYCITRCTGTGKDRVCYEICYED